MSYWRLFYHVVWATRSREPMVGEIEAEIVTRSLRDTCKDYDVILHAIGIMPDHIHIAASIPPKFAISEFVGRMKGAATHAVNHSGAWSSLSPFAWQAENGVQSFGERALPQVVDYVQNQQARHASKQLIKALERIDDQAQPASAGLLGSARGL